VGQDVTARVVRSTPSSGDRLSIKAASLPDEEFVVRRKC